MNLISLCKLLSLRSSFLSWIEKKLTYDAPPDRQCWQWSERQNEPNRGRQWGVWDVKNVFKSLRMSFRNQVIAPSCTHPFTHLSFCHGFPRRAHPQSAPPQSMSVIMTGSNLPGSNHLLARSATIRPKDSNYVFSFPLKGHKKGGKEPHQWGVQRCMCCILLKQ